NIADIVAETAVGYIDRTNNSFIEMEQEYQRALIGVSEGRPEVEFDVNSYAVRKSFKEGLTVFITSKVLRGLSEGGNQGGIMSPDLAEEVLEARATDVGDQVKAGKIESGFNRLDAYIKDLYEVFYSTGKARRRIRNESFKRVTVGDTYWAGVSFLENALVELSHYGKSESEAVNMLIMNPQTSVTDLRNPQEYVERTFNK